MISREISRTLFTCGLSSYNAGIMILFTSLAVCMTLIFSTITEHLTYVHFSKIQVRCDEKKQELILIELRQCILARIKI